MISFSLLSPVLYYGLIPALVIYWLILAPGYRHLLLTGLSCCLLAAAAPAFFAFVVATAFLISRASFNMSGMRTLLLSMAIGALTILCWKYIAGFFLSSASQHSDFRIIFTTIGVSYMALRITALIIDLNNKDVGNLSFLECLNFLSFFPTLSAGPLESITGFKKGYSENFDSCLFLTSVYRIILGLFKKLIILNILFAALFGEAITQFISSSGIPANEYSASEIFLLSMLLYLKAFLDISAYTDLALGFAGLFGYRIISDVKYPLLARDLGDFWRRWHISMMRWCQTYIYFPTFFSRKNMTIATFASLTVMGLWHNVEIKWLLWGLYQALGLTILHYWNRFKKSRQYPSSDIMHRIHIGTGTVITFVFATLAFLIMGPESLDRSVSLMQSLLGF
ncbi:MAG: hypothetical protein O6928_11020 [Gammaproteobacteria bacterium]|nr:hypothetical protein [Gammaproteobacteria bacterium]